MASLRTRVLVSLLVLAAIGLIALAAVTYAEQRSFLQSRVDQQAKGAAPALSQALDSAGYRPPLTRPFAGRPANGAPAASGAAPLPAGTGAARQAPHNR